jgi:hypothetical protein
MNWTLSIVSKLKDVQRCSKIDGSLNSSVTSSPILVRLRKPRKSWKGHCWYSATGAASDAAGGLREARKAWWRLLSTKVDRHSWLIWGCASLISGVAVDNVTRGPRCPPVGGSLLASGTNHALARAYCGMSPARKLFEDPVPRLALLLPYH